MVVLREHAGPLDAGRLARRRARAGTRGPASAVDARHDEPPPVGRRQPPRLRDQLEPLLVGVARVRDRDRLARPAPAPARRSRRAAPRRGRAPSSPGTRRAGSSPHGSSIAGARQRAALEAVLERVGATGAVHRRERVEPHGRPAQAAARLQHRGLRGRVQDRARARASQRAGQRPSHRRRLGQVGELHRAPQVARDAHVAAHDGHRNAELASTSASSASARRQPCGGAGGDEQHVDGRSRSRGRRGYGGSRPNLLRLGAEMLCQLPEVPDARSLRDRPDPRPRRLPARGARVARRAGRRTPARYEVVVVDDGPGEATRAATQAAAERSAVRVRYVEREGVPGLNSARNTGIAASRRRRSWCSSTTTSRRRPAGCARCSTGRRRHPDALVLGGPIEVRLEGFRLPLCGREAPPITALDEGPVGPRDRRRVGREHGHRPARVRACRDVRPRRSLRLRRGHVGAAAARARRARDVRGATPGSCTGATPPTRACGR